MNPTTSFNIASLIDEEFDERNVYKRGYNCLGTGKKRSCLRVKRPGGELCARCLKEDLQKQMPYHRVKAFYEAVVDSASAFIRARHMEENRPSYESSHVWVTFNNLLGLVVRDLDEALKTKENQMRYFKNQLR